MESDLAKLQDVIVGTKLIERYGSYTVVNSIDFEVPKEKYFGNLWPQWCGRPLIEEILGVTPKSGGDFIVFGLPVPHNPE